MKKTLKFDMEWMEAIMLLPEEMQSLLIGAIVKYQYSGEITELPPIAMALFLVIKATVDRRAASARRSRERRRNNKPAAIAKAEETLEEKNKRIGCRLKQDRRYLRSIASRHNVSQTEIKSEIDATIGYLNDSAISVTDLSDFATILEARIAA